MASNQGVGRPRHLLAAVAAIERSVVLALIALMKAS